MCTIANSNEPRINEEINARTVRLIGVDGSQLGVFGISDALRVAESQNLDLVEIAPNADPPVCKVLDYAKYRYEQDRKAKAARKKQAKVEIKEMAANIIPAALPDVTAAVINGNYAMDFGFKLEDAIFRDTSLNEKPYWNLVAARTADLEDPAKVELYDKVIKAFRSEATKAVLDKMFGGYVVSAGWDEDFLAPFRK